MHEVVAVSKVVIYALSMVAILVVMSVALLSILNDDMAFTENTIEIKKGKLGKVAMKLAVCGVAMVAYIVMMIIIR
jgi:hypothetical protein